MRFDAYVTTDGSSYAYGHHRQTSDLYLVEWLRGRGGRVLMAAEADVWLAEMK